MDTQLDMVEVLPQPVEEVEVMLTPTVNMWVQQTFGSLNTVQRATIPSILMEHHTLVMSPTGSGKTLAAFLGIISELNKLAEKNQLEKRIYALYVSPLKALNNDIEKNLEIPLEGIVELGGTRIKVAKRTGDTTTAQRAQQLRSPPHIMITTPESLALMLAAPKFRTHLHGVRWTIIDEIHSLAEDKRGTHMSLTLEMLQHHLPTNSFRVGLSATVEPVMEVAKFLVGNRDDHINLVNLQSVRPLELQVSVPMPDIAKAHFSKIQKQQVQILAGHIHEMKTTLVFTNTRNMAERLTYATQEAMGPEIAPLLAVHHGSLDKKVRLDVENRLKQGEMKAVFTSSSLEMGIDIGSIDLVVQFGSPKTVRSLLQRVGRSGHAESKVSKGHIIVYSLDDLLECLALARLALDGIIDKIRIPQMPMDVLAQVVVGMALEQRWHATDAFDIITKAYPYRHLTFERFVTLLHALSGEGIENGWRYSHIWFDKDTQEFGRRRSARQAYMMNIGTIPDTTSVQVVAEGFRHPIGQLTERFVEKINIGDVFILAGRTYEYLHSAGNRIVVRQAHGRAPTIPSWAGEALSRTIEVSNEVSRLLDMANNHLEDGESAAVTWICDTYPCGEMEAMEVVKYIQQQQAITMVPRIDKLVMEAYREPNGSLNYIILSLFGRETNTVLAHAYASLLSKEVSENIGMVATDNGFLIKVPPGYHTSALREFQLDKSVEELLNTTIRSTELFKFRFRHVAARALFILRHRGSMQVPVDNQQRLARLLLRTLPSDNPVLDETAREILEDTYNVKQAQKVLESLRDRSVTIANYDVDVPSPMTFEILLNGEMDAVLLQDKHSLLQSLHRQVLQRLLPGNDAMQTLFQPEAMQAYFKRKLDRLDNQEQVLAILEASPFHEADFMKSLPADAVILDDRTATTAHMLPYLLATLPASAMQQLPKEIDKQPLQELLTHVSPIIGYAQLITAYLRYFGPQSLEELESKLEVSSTHMEQAVEYLQRQHLVITGKLTKTYMQFMLLEDRNNFANEEEWSNPDAFNLPLYRWNRLHLSGNRLQVDTLTYLQEYGPINHPVDLLNRLESFHWADLREAIFKREVYFGRFLSRRLMFVHKDHIDTLIGLARTTRQLSEIEEQIIMTLAERPGLKAHQLAKLIVQPHAEVRKLLSTLEREAYVARTGWDLSQSHGSTARPQFIALPLKGVVHLDAALKQAVQLLCKWFGWLSIDELMRMTGQDYQLLEQVIQQLELVTKQIEGNLYYGMQELEDNRYIQSRPMLLNDSDPYFLITPQYMVELPPKQVRWHILWENQLRGNIDLTIPSQNTLQVLNIQIASDARFDHALLAMIADQLRQVASLIFQVQLLTIEEINHQPILAPDNLPAVTTFQQHGFQRYQDYLLSGVSAITHSWEDVLQVRRLITLQRRQRQFTDVDSVLTVMPVLQLEEIYQLFERNAKLLIKQALRHGKLYYHDGRLYAADIFPAVIPIADDSHLLSDIPKSFRQLQQESTLPAPELRSQLEQELAEGRIINLDPFDPDGLYSHYERQGDRGKATKHLVKALIAANGPLSFSDLYGLLHDIRPMSRIELRFQLAVLLEEDQVMAKSISLPEGSMATIYLIKQQLQLLDNPQRSQLFQTWQVIPAASLESDVATHQVLFHGRPFISIWLTSSTDIATITNMVFHELPEEHLPSLHDAMITLEKYIFAMGLRQIEINQINHATPYFWASLEDTA